MTDPVKSISESQGTSAGGNYSGGGFSEHHKKKGTAKQQDDLIGCLTLGRGLSKRLGTRLP